MVSLITPPVYTLKITLAGTDPVVWRRITVRGDIVLSELHYVIQAAMGWTNSHLHQFIVGNEYYGEPDQDFEEPMKEEGEYSLADIAPRKGFKFQYEYDFGDSWIHEIKVENIDRETPNHLHPVCEDGERNCPPEDVGGIWGFAELLEAVKTPKHPRRKEFKEWLGETFKPDALNLKKINTELKRMKYIS